MLAVCLPLAGMLVAYFNGYGGSLMPGLNPLNPHGDINAHQSGTRPGSANLFKFLDDDDYLEGL